MWLSPSFSHVSSHTGALLTYRRRESLIRCWNSCASTPTVAPRMKLRERGFPLIVPFGSATIM